jgi:uncharacterized beta-barrel protein YwiB (DUF1934 family)
MTARRKVRIRLDSLNREQRIVHDVEGDLYEKNDHFYIRYEETEPEMGRTTTIVKIEKSRVKIMRHGEVSSEQIFLPGEPTYGFYQTAQGKMILGVRTHFLHNRLNDNGTGELEWSYDLEVMEELAGLFTIKLTIIDIAI